MTDSHSDSTAEKRSSSPPADGSGESPRNPLDEIADSFVQRLRKGDYPPISEYVEKHPDLEDEIRSVFPTLAMLEKCGEREHSATLHHGASNSPERLGEYRIIREVARGGMGVVYEAEHDTMRRRVALKVLPTTLASSQTQLHRFHREARAAGRLHHTNIVPVFEVGMDRGLHYYAMQFIQGQSLDVVFDELQRMQQSTEIAGPATPTTAAASMAKSIAGSLLSGRFSASQAEDAGEQTEQHGQTDPALAANLTVDVALPLQAPQTPLKPSDTKSESASDLVRASSSGLTESSESYFHRVARIGLQAADAISFAHNHGVLHRDIKPANIILDASGVAWLTDFGLAKSDEGNLTMSGDIVGTLRYMAPERFSGASDARTDIYGLGVTLYELATLQIAFPQNDRANLIHDITHDDPPRPRRIDRRMPRDLETIILKCIDRQPSRRYPSADELAKDLRRFLADRPIAARRSSAIERGWRLCRRNPVPASLAICVLLLMVVVVIGSIRFGILSRRQATKLRDTIDAAQRAEREARESERKASSHFYELCVGRAESGLWSGRMGQGFESLKSVAQAAQLLPDMKLVEQRRDEETLKLRNLAVAAMALVDLRVERAWDVANPWTTSATFDSDFETLAVSDRNGNIHLLDATEAGDLDKREVKRILPSPGKRAWALQISGDGRRLAAKYHDAANPAAPAFVLWDLESGEPLFQIDTGQMKQARYKFSRDSSKLAIGMEDGRVLIYSAEDGSVQQTVQAGYEPLDVAFNAAGSRLATCGRSTTVHVWDLDAEPPAQLHELKAPATVTTLDWSRRNSRLAAGTISGQLLVWPDDTFQSPPWLLEPHKARVTRVSIHPDGDLLVSYGWDGITRVNDLRSQQQVLRVDGEMMLATGFGRGGRIGFERENRQLSVWSLPKTKALRVLESNLTSNRRTNAFHPQHENLLASSTRQGVELWDVGAERIIARVANKTLCRLQFSPDGSALYTSDRSGIRRWPLQVDTAGAELNVEVGEPSTVREGQSERLSFSQDGRTLAVDSGPQTAMLIDVESGEQRRAAQHWGLDHVLLTPDAEIMVTTTWHGAGMMVWDTNTGKLLRNLAPGWSSTSIAISSDGRWLAGASGGERALWDVADWTEVRREQRQNADNWPGPVRFSRDGSLLVNASSRYVPQIQLTKSGRIAAVLQAPQAEGVGSLSFSARDRFLAIGNDRHIHIWDLQTIRRDLAAIGLDWEDESPAE